MMKAARTQPFSLLGMGTVGIRSFNLGITIPTFVLSDNYAHRYSLVQLLSVAAGKQNNLQRCRQVAHISVDSIAKSVGIETDKIIFAIENIIHNVGEIASHGSEMLIDFGIGTLHICENVVQFHFSQNSAGPLDVVKTVN